MARLRAATAEDVPAIEALVREAYSLYLPRMDKPPGPMLDDYAQHVAAGRASVLEEEGRILGLLVLVPATDHLLLDNVAVSPSAQGRGFGRLLMEAAEAEARRRGYREIRLYTHETMVENVARYLHLGYEETHRGEQAGYSRVFMRKVL